MGHHSILPKACQKILNFPTPTNKKEAQKCIRLFGFWKNHIPHFGQIFHPLYKVTWKKYEFDWGNKKTCLSGS